MQIQAIMVRAMSVNTLRHVRLMERIRNSVTKATAIFIVIKSLSIYTYHDLFGSLL
jgi:hypothetical protein